MIGIAQSAVTIKAVRRQPGRFGWRPISGVALYLIAAALACGVHIALGGSFSVLFIAYCAVVVSAAPALVFGVRDMPSLFTLIAGAQYVSFALFWKIFEGGAFDSGLYSAHTTCVVILIGTLAQASAVFLVHVLWPRAALFKEKFTPNGTLILLGIGFSFITGRFLLSVFSVSALGGVLQILGDGVRLLLTGWLGYRYYTGKPLISIHLVGILLALIVLSFASNSRQGALDGAIVATFFVLAFRVRVSLPVLAGVAVFGILFMTIVSPAILAARGSREGASGLQLIENTLDQVQGRIVGRAQDTDVAEGGAYRLRYFKTRNNILPRIMVLPELDFIVAKTEQFGPVGTDRYFALLPEILPSLVVSQKIGNAQTDYKFWVYGVVAWGFVNELEITPYGDAYSYGGLPFTFATILAQNILFFLFCRLVCPRFDRSLFAVFLLATNVHGMTGGNALSLVSDLVRVMPLEFALFWLASRFGTPPRTAASRSVR